MQNIIHITTSNYLSLSNEQLIITNKERDENKISLNNILAVVIENCYCRLSVMLQLKLAERNIPLIICNEKHHPALHSLSLYSYYHLAVKIQEQISWDLEKKNNIWNEIIKIKIKHQKELLQYFKKSDSVIEKLELYMENISNNSGTTDSNEAIASRVYFQELFGKSFKRFYNDSVNSALNYGYAILRSLISSKVVAKGFHPSLGIRHHSQFNNYNFSDDIIEIFRPMVDYVVYMNVDSQLDFNREFRQKLLLTLIQKLYWNGKSYELGKVIEFYLDNVRNYFSNGDEIIIPEIRIENYDY
ncbi:type II CRISPR-associated endonuclease Cas1 [Fusobacterium sp. PH5-44]|uniref:type II CRISPR-associated endonuclease Cas1 n=1 Tax=unclassified Fusobacterium TaxID=2648384 RepID=UPI003D1DDB7A